MRTMFKYNSTTILRESPKQNNNMGLTHVAKICCKQYKHVEWAEGSLR